MISSPRWRRRVSCSTSRELAENFASFSRALRDAWSDEAFVAYSVKNQSLPWILDIAKREGCLAEVVSDEE